MGPTPHDFARRAPARNAHAACANGKRESRVRRRIADVVAATILCEQTLLPPPSCTWRHAERGLHRLFPTPTGGPIVILAARAGVAERAAEGTERKHAEKFEGLALCAHALCALPSRLTPPHK